MMKITSSPETIVSSAASATTTSSARSIRWRLIEALLWVIVRARRLATGLGWRRRWRRIAVLLIRCHLQIQCVNECRWVVGRALRKERRVEDETE